MTDPCTRRVALLWTRTVHDWTPVTPYIALRDDHAFDNALTFVRGAACTRCPAREFRPARVSGSFTYGCETGTRRWQGMSSGTFGIFSRDDAQRMLMEDAADMAPVGGTDGR